jgi:hypothetical protein
VVRSAAGATLAGRTYLEGSLNGIGNLAIANNGAAVIKQIISTDILDTEILTVKPVAIIVGALS